MGRGSRSPFVTEEPLKKGESVCFQDVLLNSTELFKVFFSNNLSISNYVCTPNFKILIDLIFPNREQYSGTK